MSTPTVTVIIPAYNAEDCLGETLASIQAQTFTDLEVLLIDDGSTDGTLRVADEYSKSLNLTVIQQANAGPSAARNNGIRRARGRYCALLDADDLMLPELMETQVRMLDADDRIGFVVSDVATFDAGGTIQSAHWNLAAMRPESALEELLMRNYVTTSAVMAPTRCLIETGLFNEARRVAEDYELWLRLAAKWKVGIIDRSLVRYRYRPGSLSDNRLYSAECALEVIEEFWNEHPGGVEGAPGLKRRSLAQHLANAASAASTAGAKGTALSYTARSLMRDPSVLRTWKILAKIVLQRSPRRVVRESAA
jgi:glycosyltransferase involved in cell wall biosynthesis